VGRYQRGATRDETLELILNDVHSTCDRLPKAAPRILPLPLHAGLPAEDQQVVFDPAGRDTRKVIVATNIAEASVTIEGIVYVVDCGFVKVSRSVRARSLSVSGGRRLMSSIAPPQIKTYNPKTGMDVLTVTPCSVASANQRSGRAGRTQPGKSYRLYPHSAITLGIMPPTTPPELIRSDISLFILQLKALGIDNVLRFDWMDSPPSEMMIRAMEFLFSLKAIDESGRLTRPLGVCMAEVPVDPMMAAIVSPIGRARPFHIANIVAHRIRLSYSTRTLIDVGKRS
jgi:ATP-dependent RNA helicase DDX35